MQTNFSILNSAGTVKHGLFTVRNAAASDKPAEILIYEQIGKDWFSNDGINAKDFDKALKEIPDKKQIQVRINSPGGNVWDGIAIYNMLDRIRDRVTVYVDGIAASIASVIAMAGKSIVMPKNATMMIHDASGLCMGNAQEMRKLADVLDQHSDQIADIYAKRSGKTKEDFRALMKEETWFTGEEAKQNGLADTVSDETTIIANFDLSRYRRVPAAIQNNSAPENGGDKNKNTLMRDKIIALLNAHKIAFDNSATDEQLAELLNKIQPQSTTPPAPAATIAPAAQPTNVVNIDDLLQKVAKLENANSEERKARITATVNKAVEENRLPAAQADFWITQAMASPDILAKLAELPQVPPGPEPSRVEITGTDPKNIEKGILGLWGSKNILDSDQVVQRGRERANIIAKHWGTLMPILNDATSYTVSSDLKRTVILQEMIRAFAVKVLPLTAFSTTLNGRRLEGTDKVSVPYFALNTTASTAYVAANGYDTFADANSDARTVTIDKRQYQGLSWTSAELRRQPFLDTAMHALLLAQQLGLDVVNDVLSIVTAANFSGVAHTGPAGAFDSDDIADIKGVCDAANWPEGMRSLILNSAYDVNLLKDQSVKAAYAFGDNGPIREGRIKRIVGFDYFPDSRVPGNSENLQGMAAFKSAILFAVAAVEPTPEVRSQLTRYEAVVEPSSNSVLEYRLWGNPDLDSSREIIECNYGKAKGEGAAIQRVRSAA